MAASHILSVWQQSKGRATGPHGMKSGGVKRWRPAAWLRRAPRPSESGDAHGLDVRNTDTLCKKFRNKQWLISRLGK
jgi:hypothetical protein